MDYVTRLFKLLRDDKILDSFIRNLFDFSDNENYTLSSLRILPYEEGNAIYLIVANMLVETKMSIADYKIRFVEENDQFIRPEWRGYTDRYLKFMSEHFSNFANDCIQDKILECEKNKHKEINKLEKLFVNSRTNKKSL